MAGLATIPAAVQELGLPSLARYGVYWIGQRSGWFRLRTPTHGWNDRPLGQWLTSGTEEQVLLKRERFFFDPLADFASALRAFQDGAARPLQQEAEAILSGRFRLFGAAAKDLGFPPAWHRFHLAQGEGTPGELPADRHWSAYRLEGPVDFKLIWELSRFAWIYPLARAYRMSGEHRYWEGCQNLLASWRQANPPNAGPQWISAQEVSIRVLALLFAWQAFTPALRKDLAAARELAETIVVHAARIPATLIYARAQRNNHLLLEALGLYSVGLEFPQLRKAQEWRTLGRDTLLAALADQVSADGGYIQHSVNYHRMALQAGLWASRLAELRGEPLPAHAEGSLRRLAGCLSGLVHPETGLVPNLGHNDGTELLPLSSCDYPDHRPALQAAGRLQDGSPPYPRGPWDEFGFWLGIPASEGLTAKGIDSLPPAGPPPWGPSGSVAASDEVSSVRLSPRDAYPQAGLYLVRGKQTQAMLRCAEFTTRPAHADQLHLDLWWRNENLALDPGSYRYAAPAPWDNALSRAAVHNGPIVGGSEPMRRVGRFLWLDWAQGRFIGRWRSDSGALELLLAQHAGYRSLGTVVRRAVLRAGESLWLVIDEAIGRGPRVIQTTWTLPDWDWDLRGSNLRLQSPTARVALSVEAEDLSLALYRAGRAVAGGRSADEPVLGWWSPTYAHKQPALALAARSGGAQPLRMLSWWILEDADPSELVLEWRPPEADNLPLIAAVWRGERLEL